MEIILWFIIRQFEALIVLTRNTGDVFNARIITIYWRLFDLILIILCAIPTNVDESSTWFQIFLMFMTMRGLLWQLLFIIINLCVTIGVTVKNVFYLNKQCDTKMKWFQLLFIIHYNNANVSNTELNTVSSPKEKTQTCCGDRIKIEFVVLIWILILIYAILSGALTNGDLFKFCAIMTSIYYVLILFERGKYNVVYCLFNNSFHEYIWTVIIPTKYQRRNSAMSIGNESPEISDCDDEDIDDEIKLNKKYKAVKVYDLDDDRKEMDHDRDIDKDKEKSTSQGILLTVNGTKSRSRHFRPSNTQSTHMHIIDDNEDDSTDLRHLNIRERAGSSDTERDEIEVESTVQLQRMDYSVTQNSGHRSIDFTKTAENIHNIHTPQTTKINEYDEYDITTNIDEVHGESMDNINASMITPQAKDHNDRSEGTPRRNPSKRNGLSSHHLSQINIEIEVIDIMEFWDVIDYDYHQWCQCCHCCRTTHNIFSTQFWKCQDCDCSKEYMLDWSAWCCKRSVIWIFAIVCFVLIFLVVSTLRANNRIATPKVSPGDSDDIFPSYPLCDMNTRVDVDLSTIDLVYFAIASYSNEPEEVIRDIKQWYGDEYDLIWNISGMYYQNSPTFFHIENIETGYDLIAIRGTNSMQDAIMDIALWSEIFTFQLLSLVIPLTDLLPVGFIRSFVDFASFPEEFIAPDIRATYDEPVYDYIVSNVIDEDNKNDSRIVLSGHSVKLYIYLCQ